MTYEDVFRQLDPVSQGLSDSNRRYYERCKTEGVASGDDPKMLEMTLRGLIWDAMESESADESAK